MRKLKCKNSNNTQFIRRGAEAVKKDVRLKQPTLCWPTRKTEQKETKEERKGEEERRTEEMNDKGTYFKGSRKEDNQRYRDFLAYCEERRRESRRDQEDDIERKMSAESKSKHWEMMRLSTEFLKQNEQKWRTRKIEECDRIRELEKK